MVYEQFYYDALEERIRVVAAGKEGVHDLYMDRLLLFREVKRTTVPQNIWTASVVIDFNFIIDKIYNKNYSKRADRLYAGWLYVVNSQLSIKVILSKFTR